MVDASSGRYARGELQAVNMWNTPLLMGLWAYLGDRRSNESIVETCHQEFVDHTRWSTIVYQGVNRGTQAMLGKTVLIETAMEPPKATHALSMVSANPHMLNRP